MTDRGWTSRHFDVLCVQFIDWLASAAPERRAGVIPRVGAFREVHSEIDDETLDAVLAATTTRGWVRPDSGFGGFATKTAWLTDEGKAKVQALRERRRARSARAIACRDAILDWLYNEGRDAFPDEVEEVQGRPWSYFEGDPFSVEELRAAAAHLAERDLIGGVRTAYRDDPLRPRLTADGRECVEQYDSSTVAFSRRHQAQGSAPVTHFHGPVHGQVGIAGGDVHQSQVQGIDADTLQRLLDDVRRAAEEIEPNEAAYLLAYVDTLQAEATAVEPKPALAVGAADRLTEISAKAGNAGLIAAVTALVNFVLKARGIN